MTAAYACEGCAAAAAAAADRRLITDSLHAHGFSLVVSQIVSMNISVRWLSACDDAVRSRRPDDGHGTCALTRTRAPALNRRRGRMCAHG